MRTATLFILALALTLPLTGQAADADTPVISGAWQLNEKQSDDIAALMAKAPGGRNRPEGGGHGMGGMQGGGGGGGGGRGGGPGGGGGGDQPDEDQQARMQKRMEQMKLQYSRLDIFQDGLELNVTDGLDISHLLYTDGRQSTIWTRFGEAKATAVWRGRTLDVSWKTRQDTQTRERHYTVSQDGKQLIVTEERTIPGKDEHVSLKLVYDRAD